MAQAFIQYVLKQEENKHLENQIKSLRNNLPDEFDDSDDDILVRASNQAEKDFKRKRKIISYDKENKKPKLNSAFTCDLCDRHYKHLGSLDRHLQTHFQKHSCGKCGKSFTRKYKLTKHKGKCLISHRKQFAQLDATEKEKNTDEKEQSCKHCGIPFNNYAALFHHITTAHPLNQTGGNIQKLPTENVQEPELEKKSEQRRTKVKKNAINNLVQQVDIIPMEDEKYDLLQFLANVKENVESELITTRETHHSIKWNVIGRVEMIRDVDNGEQEKTTPHFRSKNYISLQDENNEHNINEAFQGVNKSLEEFVSHGSNWVVNKVLSLEINTVKYSPVSGSSYLPLPRKIRFSRGVININNSDQMCFLWSVLAALHPAPKNPQEVYHYRKYENELNMKDIDYPVSLSKMEKFEKLNNISINVFGFEDGDVFPLYLTKLPNGYKEVDLLYFSNEEKSHFCLVKNLDHFLGSTTKFHTKRYYCRRCLHGFIRSDLLNEHRPYCNKFDFQKVEFPKQGNDIISFKDFDKQIPVPFVIYADFEAFARKVDTCLPDPDKSSTTHRTKFEACGYSYIVVSTNERYTKSPVVYRGDDAVQHFFDDMLKEEEYIKEKLSHIEPMMMNEESEKTFQNATHCYICNQPFTNLIKCRDHDHLGTGDPTSDNYTNFRNAACQSCNLNLQHPSFIPVFFHNLRGFDLHLLMTKLGNYKDKKLSVIAQNSERYISFSLGNLRFLDSFQFMTSSLEALVNNLAADGLVNFKQFRKAFSSVEAAKLLLQKNEYCYDYVDCSEKFSETKLPSMDAFYNNLKKEPISEKSYQHAVKVWDFFEMKTLGDFHDMYVKTDCLLLCDVFEKFRQMCLQSYKLDACHFYTSPGLAWQAALKMSGISLELLTDPTMYNIFELGIRGGVSMVCKKYSKANHIHLDDFNPTQESKHIMYLDANNLYGWAMRQPLPTGMMRFLSDDEINQFDLQQKTSDSDEGYILEVDLQCPPEIHDKLNSLPIAPTHKKVSDQELSSYSQNLWKKLNGENRSRVKTEKLVPTLEDKLNYIVHYQNLQQYVELGMKVKKIHKIVAFHQTPWLRTYIDFNAIMRKNAKNEFEKDFFKLMCNR